MNSAKVDVFFSCSFDAVDSPVNEFFMAICRALDLHMTNVSTGSSLTPPEVAKQKIDACQGLVAVCTKRSELKDGGFVMPQAVHDEISFAFGKDTPVLMIVEKGVSIQGFKSNFGTYLEFERDKLASPSFLENAVKAIHDLKLQVLGPHQLGTEQGMSDSYAEYVHHMVELKDVGSGEYTWEYSTTKKLIFTHSSKRGFPSGVWSTVPANVPQESAQVRWGLELKNSSRGISLAETIEKQTPSCIEVLLKPTPSAEEGDFIEYSTMAASRYINPVWLDEVAEGACIHLDESDKRCADGLVFIHRTKSAILEFRFARSYGLTKRDVVPFVGSYTSSIDYEVKSELTRADTRVEDFGGTVVVRMEIDSPLPGHMYGVAWDPRPRPELALRDKP